MLQSLKALEPPAGDTEAKNKSDVDAFSEVEVLWLVDTGLAERWGRYLVECGVDPEEAAEVVASEFEFSELDVLWMNYVDEL